MLFCYMKFLFSYRKHSDDPLISGALDDNQNEFDTITDCGRTLASIETAPANFNKKPNRTRKSGNLKLRFHHQALPQEYLDHYEATQNQFHTKEMTIGSSSGNTRSIKKDRIATSSLASPSSDLVEQECQDVKSDKVAQLWSQKTGKHQNGKDSRTVNDSSQTKMSQKPPAKLTAQDLPYMGEITLDNFKPRRGRKPKKADICHLIYKNYGTVVPDQRSDDLDVEIKASNNSATVSQSLLEKRLTKTIDDQNEQSNNNTTKDGAEEPLNLCVRDSYDCDVMTVIDDDGNDCEKRVEFKSEMLSANDQISNLHFAPNLKMALPNFQSVHLGNKNDLTDSMDIINPGVDLNGYWQNSGMFNINPMVLYLQKFANANTNANATTSQNSIEPPKSDPIDSNVDLNSSRTRQKRMLVPKKMSQLLKNSSQNVATTSSSGSNSNATASKINNKSNAQSNAKNTHAPKRKRSAIFIPPVPEESSTNHATEVSICKFKFTGGAKPSLQEKKMLSVDAGGNFRYYSGTGDKSIRGYEFFPRESLKQSSLMSASSAGAFLNTPGQKIANDHVPPPSFGISNELLQIPEISTPNSVGILSSPNLSSNSLAQQQHSKQHFHSSRKRKSKRSMQREKLEKTFKEKGFLIQTQQLEEKEGTYCKFRQLRKFTRYLFRSWRDYLPNVNELQQNQPNQTTPTTPSIDHNVIDPSVPSPSSSHEE